MVVSELAPGTMIAGRYRLERLLGEGGMGVVWAAGEVAADRRCALKLMKDPAGDPELRRRFLREARAAAAVRHPNVVRIFEVLEPEDAPPAIAMELLEGEPLRALLVRAGRLPAAELAEIMAPVVSAVGAAHALGIVHRDLKPENIFLARDPGGERVVKVLDFGIAKLTALDGEVMRSTGITTGVVLGTPAYMAPEQVFAEKDLDHRADIWALGVIFYECLAGACPTEGANIGQILKHVVARPFAPLEQLAPEAPAALCRLVARMLAREPGQRPADLREVQEVLAPLVGAAAPPIPPFGPPAEHLRHPAEVVVAATTPRSPLASAAAALASTETAALAATAPVAAISPVGATSSVAATPAAVAAAPRHRGRRLAALAGGVVAVALGAVAARSYWLAAPAGSPLDPPDARLACPVLRASGVEAPAGWLGAAAAAVACERARVLLGGRPERTLAPAELLDLPRGPADTFPDDPYGQLDAPERSATAARQRAAAYLDGDVTWSNARFSVALSLRRADGSELARATGAGRALYEAVRAAMAPLVGAGRIPRAAELDPAVAAWARTRDVDDALAALDLTFAFVQNAGSLPDECRRFGAPGAPGARLQELGPEGRWTCAYTLGELPPPVTLDAADPSPAARATRIRIEHAIHQTVRPGDVGFLREQLQDERTPPRGRALLAATESCLLGSARSEEARARAIAAVQSEPKVSEGGSCNPWEQLITMERNTRGADGAMRAMQAWVPWNSYAWLEPAFSSGGTDPAVLRLLRRARVLSPFDAHIADTLVGGLLASGERAAARSVAIELRGGGLRLHEVASELILVRVETSEAHFGAALARARTAGQISGADTGWIRQQRFELAWHALELAVLLGRGREVADLLVERFIEPGAMALDSNAPSAATRTPAICARSSAPARCFERLHALRGHLAGAITPDTDAFLRGAERYVQGDFDGAAAAWRPLLGGLKMLATVLPEAMVDAFERVGAPDLAEQVDREVMKRAGELNGATLGHQRAARRALARGDREAARALAAKVVEAWSMADEEPPALAEMRRILEPPAKR